MKTAYQELDAWLGENANGNAWRVYLRSDDLEAQVALGDEADPAALQSALERYRSDAAGLEKRRFQAVAGALEQWISERQRSLQDNLPELARASRNDYRGVSEEEFRQVRLRLRGAAQRLEQRLGKGTELARGWRNYLNWDSLSDHLQLDAPPSSASLENLELASRRLRTNAPGLEREEFVQVAESLDAYREIAPWALVQDQAEAERSYGRYVEQMALQLERHEERPTTETEWKIGRIVGLVERLGDSPELVAEVRRRFVRPNVRASITANLLNQKRGEMVDSVRPVRDVILGTQIFGRARMLGIIDFRAVPSQERAELNVMLSGTAFAHTTGYNGPAVIRSVGNTSISASKRILLTDERFASLPAAAHAQTDTRILSVNKNGGGLGRRIVQRVGRRRAAEQKLAAEREASLHAAQRAARSFDEEVAEALANARRNYESKIRDPLTRRGFLPDNLQLSTTSSHFEFGASFAQASQLGADRPPPPQTTACDVCVQIHDTAVSNYLKLALGGVVLAQKDADTPLQVTGEAPPWLKKAGRFAPRARAAAKAATGPLLPKVAEVVGKQADAQASGIVDNPSSPPAEEPLPATEPPPFRPWSMTLNKEAPVSVAFHEGKVLLRIRTSRLESGEDQFEDWDFLVAYAIERRDKTIVLKRSGPIEIFPTGFDPAWDKSLSSQKSAFRNTLAKNMNARADAGEGFPVEISLPGITLPGGQVFHVSELACEQGWLTLALQTPPQGGLP